jgi:hypothetical protein
VLEKTSAQSLRKDSEMQQSTARGLLTLARSALWAVYEVQLDLDEAFSGLRRAAGLFGLTAYAKPQDDCVPSAVKPDPHRGTTGGANGKREMSNFSGFVRLRAKNQLVFFFAMTAITNHSLCTQRLTSVVYT